MRSNRNFLVYLTLSLSALTAPLTAVQLPKTREELCKHDSQFGENDTLEIRKRQEFLTPNKSHLLLNEGSSFKIYEWNEDLSQVLVILDVGSENIDATLEKLRIANMFGDKNFNKPNFDLRVSPKFTSLYCLKLVSGDYQILYVSERYRRTLQNAPKDPRFMKYMSSLKNRMDFYYLMIQSFSAISWFHMKHCDVRPVSINYREDGDAWLSNYDDLSVDVTLIPVTTNFNRTLGWGSSCIDPPVEYTEPAEFGGNINSSEEYSENVEYFSLSLVYLYIETQILDKLVENIEDKEPLNNILAKIPSSTKGLLPYLNVFYSLQGTSLSEIFSLLLLILNRFNTAQKQQNKLIDFSYSMFKKDVEYLGKGMKAYYEFLLNHQKVDTNNIKKLLKVYDNFTELLATMVRENNATIFFERPSGSLIRRTFNLARIDIQKLNFDVTRRARQMLLI